VRTGEPAARPSFLGAFRAAARPFDLRSDIPYIPALIRSRGVWVPVALAVGAFALALLSHGPNTLVALMVQLFLYPPTIAGAFLAGLLAPRATYIAGGIAGLAGSLLFVLLVLAAPNSLVGLASGTAAASPSPSGSATASEVASASAAPSASAGASPVPSPTPSPTPAPGTPIDITSASTLSAIVESIFVSTVFGIAIGGAGGYYKRFLYASNPARQKRALEQQRQKQRQQAPKKRF
jgi:hypothetical protein